MRHKAHNSAPKYALLLLFCRHIGLLFGKRLGIGFENGCGILSSSRFRIRCRYIVSILESGLLNIQIRGRIRRLRVDGTRIRKEKLAD